MGNKFAWFLACLLVLVVALFIVIRLVFPPTTDPDQTKAEGLLELQKVSFWPVQAVGAKPGGGGDAADDYCRAVEICMGKAMEIQRIRQSLKKKGVAVPPDAVSLMKEVHEHVANGARKASASYAGRFADRLRIAPGFMPAGDLRRVHDVLLMLIIHYNNANQHGDLEKVARDSFTMGWHLVSERGHVNVVLVGLQLQFTGLGGLYGLYDKGGPKANPDAIREIEQYKEQMQEIASNYSRKMHIVHPPEPHPGDVFNIAENDQDHAWRVLGIQTLVLVKFTAGGRGDKVHARRLIKRYSKSDDKLFAAAGKAAGKFTEKDFNMYRAPLLADAVTWPPGAERD